MKHYYCVLACVSVFFNAAYASTYSVDLSQLNGNYAYPSGFHSSDATTSFDLGVQFSSITSVELVVTAVGTRGSFIMCLYSDCTHNTFGGKMNYGFFHEPGYRSPRHGSILLSQESDTYTENINGPFDILLDGAGRFHVATEVPVFIALSGLEVNYLSPTTLNVYDLSLKIEGTAVPLPSAIWLFYFGIISLFSYNFRGRSQTAG